MEPRAPRITASVGSASEMLQLSSAIAPEGKRMENRSIASTPVSAGSWTPAVSTGCSPRTPIANSMG